MVDKNEYYGIESHTEVVLNEDGTVKTTDGGRHLAATKLVIHLPDFLFDEAAELPLTHRSRRLFTPATHVTSATVTPDQNLESSNPAFFDFWNRYIDMIQEAETRVMERRVAWANG